MDSATTISPQHGLLVILDTKNPGGIVGLPALTVPRQNM